MSAAAQDLLIILANLLPIGTYFCVLGLLHAIGRPFVTTSVRDFVALALALSGLVINGPIDYLLHHRMLPQFLVHSHWAGVVLYLVLVAALLPRSSETIVIYNATEATVAEALRGIFARCGLTFQDVPGGWVLPQRGVSLELDSFAALRNVTVRFRGIRDRSLYELIQNELIQSLSQASTGWSLVGMVMASAGGLILALPVWMLARNPQGMAALFRQVLETW